MFTKGIRGRFLAGNPPSHYSRSVGDLGCCRQLSVSTWRLVATYSPRAGTKISEAFGDEHGKVPVTFEVRYSAEGLFLGARLLCVGNWTRDRFHPNDGLLGVQPWRMFSSKQALTLLNHFATSSKLLSLRQSVRSRTRRNFSDLKTNQALPSSRDCKKSQIPLGETVGFRVLPLLRLRRSEGVSCSDFSVCRTQE